ECDTPQMIADGSTARKRFSRAILIAREVCSLPISSTWFVGAYPHAHHSSLPLSPYWLAISARGPHPFPFRTRQLSPVASMVLRSRGRGRVDRRQPPHKEADSLQGVGFFALRDQRTEIGDQRSEV